MFIFVCDDDGRGINEKIYTDAEEALEGILTEAPVLEEWRVRLKSWLHWAKPGAALEVWHDRVAGYVFCAGSVANTRVWHQWKE